MHIFPFTLSGPAFLVFYLIFAAIALGISLTLQSRREAPIGAALPRLTDPCEIALLRTGAGDAIMVAMVSLEDQGALMVASRTDVSAVAGTQVQGRNILEAAVLRFFQTAGTTHPRGVYADRAVRRALRDMRDSLIQRGLLAKRWDLLGNGRVAPLIVTLATLYGIAFARIAHSGRPFSFLVMLVIGSTLLSFVIFLSRRTGLGDAVLAYQRRLFEIARKRLRQAPHGAVAADIALVAAVFGLSALPAFALERYMPPPKGDGSGGGSDSGCSSSGCGSSCGSGGGCGGGGCGGGCGS